MEFDLKKVIFEGIEYTGDVEIAERFNENRITNLV